QATSDQFLEQVADALAVADAGKGGVLAAQAVAAGERPQSDESRLARRGTDGFEAADAVLEGHRRRRTARSVSSIDIWIHLFKPDANVDAARGLISTEQDA